MFAIRKGQKNDDGNDNRRITRRSRGSKKRKLKIKELE